MNIISLQPFILTTSDSILLEHPEHFSRSNFLIDFLRVIGWVVVQMFRVLSFGAESVLDAVYEFLDITQSAVFLNFYEEFRPLFPIALTLSFIILGMIYMFSDKRPKVFKNMFMGLLVLFGATTATNYLNQAIMLSHDYFTTDTSMTDETIKAHITDLIYMDSIGWNYSSGQFNQLSGNAITFLDPSEKVNKKSDVSSLGKEIFNTYFIIDSVGDIVSQAIGTRGWFDIFDPPYYYRYKINYFRIYIMLIANTAVFIIASYKAFKIIHELMITRIAGALLAGDLTSGQKTKKVIENFVSAYLCLFFILASFKLYNICQDYINLQSWNSLTKMFVTIFAGLVVLDGPNIIEKLFGMDIGLSNEMFKLMSVGRIGSGAASMAAHAASGLGRAASTFGKMTPGKGIKNDNPNKDKQGETKEPKVDPISKPKSGPYSNSAEPNNQVRSGSLQNSDMSATTSSTNTSSGFANQTDSFDQDESTRDNSFSQDTKEPNEDLNAYSGVNNANEAMQDSSNSNLDHDISQVTNDSAKNDGNSLENPNSVQKSGVDGSHQVKESNGNLKYADGTGGTGADETRMGKNVASGNISNSTNEPSKVSQNNSHISGSVPLGREYQDGQSSQPKRNTDSGSLNSRSIQEPGRNSEPDQSSIATEMGALRSEGTDVMQNSEPGSNSGQLSDSTPGYNGVNGSKANQSMNTQPGNHITNQQIPSPEDEKTSFLDQKWGVGDVAPKLKSSSKFTGNSGSSTSGSNNLQNSSRPTKDNNINLNTGTAGLLEHGSSTIESDSVNQTSGINASNTSPENKYNQEHGETTQPNSQPGEPDTFGSNKDSGESISKGNNTGTLNSNQINADTNGSGSFIGPLLKTGNSVLTNPSHELQPKETNNATQKINLQQESVIPHPGQSEIPQVKRRGRGRPKKIQNNEGE